MHWQPGAHTPLALFSGGTDSMKELVIKVGKPCEEQELLATVSDSTKLPPVLVPSMLKEGLA